MLQSLENNRYLLHIVLCVEFRQPAGGYVMVESEQVFMSLMQRLISCRSNMCLCMTEYKTSSFLQSEREKMNKQNWNYGRKHCSIPLIWEKCL